MAAAVSTAYLNSTMCQNLGPSCVQSSELFLYGDELQPADGTLTPITREAVPILGELERLMYVVAWGGTNADAFLSNLARFTSDVFHVWPGGSRGGAPFSQCDVPVVLAFDFPDNFWHTIAAYTAVWHAVRRGALDDRASFAVLLPHASLARREYLFSPLRAVVRGPVLLYADLAGWGSRVHGADAATAEAAGLQAYDGEPGDRIALSPHRCLESLAMCTVAGYHDRPPRGMFDFMQAVKDGLLGAPPNYDELHTRVRPHELPPPFRPFASAPSGALRVVFAIRSTGSRRVVNAEEVLRDCGAASPLSIPGQPGPVALTCSLHSFGASMAADAAAMHEADVLVAVHGAGLTNMGFLRPGASVVEVRPASFDANNADRFFRPLALDSGAVKWWGLVLHDHFLAAGAMEAARIGNPDKYGRDKDVTVPWHGVAEALKSVLGLTWASWAAVEPKAITRITH